MILNRGLTIKEIVTNIIIKLLNNKVKVIIKAKELTPRKKVLTDRVVQSIALEKYWTFLLLIHNIGV